MREQRKFDDEGTRRGSESPSARADRIAKYEKRRKRDWLMMSQLTAAFNSRLTGEKEVLGRAVYTLKATPRPGYRPPDASVSWSRSRPNEAKTSRRCSLMQSVCRFPASGSA